MRSGISPSELGARVLDNCLAALLVHFPQLDGAFAALPCVPDEEMDGLGTDGRVLYFEPLALLRRYRDCPAAVRRGWLHILLHCLYLHPFQSHAGRLWDLAADLAVEQIIEQTAPPSLALPPDPVRAECFRVLGCEVRSAASIQGLLEDGAFPFSMEELEAAFAFDTHSLWPQDRAEGQQTAKRWRGLAAGAGRGGARAGHTAGSASETILLPRQRGRDYRDFLQKFARRREELLLDDASFDPVLYTFGLARYGDMPLVEPLETREVSRLAELVIAIDTSGSCSAEDVCRFLTETRAILCRRESFFREIRVYLIQCDCVIQQVQVIRSVEEWEKSANAVTVQGRGGTDFTPVFRYVERLRREKELRELRALLYFTDGDGVYPRERPDYETAFIALRGHVHREHAPPWITWLELEEEPV